MVDEYQDTNHAQFVLISLLASTINEYGEVEHNLCVVGDDDQSIYRFRNANPNIFKEKYDRYARDRCYKRKKAYNSVFVCFCHFALHICARNTSDY